MQPNDVPGMRRAAAKLLHRPLASERRAHDRRRRHSGRRGRTAPDHDVRVNAAGVEGPVVLRLEHDPAAARIHGQEERGEGLEVHQRRRSWSAAQTMADTSFTVASTPLTVEIKRAPRGTKVSR